MLLIEAFAVIRVDAASNLKAPAELHLAPPVGVRERLARGRDQVAGPLGEGGLRLPERAEAAAPDRSRAQRK